MYGDQTFETILKRMLGRAPADVDIRKASLIYDGTAPAAMELESLYIALGIILDETFADTNSREYLILRAAERGITPEEATNAILLGLFDIAIPLNSRYSLNDLNYTAIAPVVDENGNMKKSEAGYYQYQMKCETAGTIGNGNFGNLIPIEYIQDLTYAKLTEVLIPGEDEEATEDLRTRYFASFNMVAFGGNIADYMEKTLSIAGVGAVKVTPVWNGGGTVRLTILDSEFHKATNTLINTVQQIIDPTQDQTGLGLAPIGHIVTVDTATELTIDVSMNIAFDTGYTFETVEDEIRDILESYFLSLRKEWSPPNIPIADDLVVRISKIESAILGITGVIDIEGTELNGDTKNLAVGKYEIPVLGNVVNIA